MGCECIPHLLLKASGCQALVVELSALKIKKYALYKICFWVSKGGCREHPRNWAGQSAGFAQTSSVSCISQRQGQAVPKGPFLCSWMGSPASSCCWSLGVSGGVWLRIAAAPRAQSQRVTWGAVRNWIRHFSNSHILYFSVWEPGRRGKITFHEKDNILFNGFWTFPVTAPREKFQKA